MGLRSFVPIVAACPGCGRTTSTVFQELASEIQSYVRERMAVWRGQYPGVESLNLAVMGCIVNGPGESKHADIGISLPGTGEAPTAPVFIDGKKAMTLARRQHRHRVQGHRGGLRGAAIRTGVGRNRRQAVLRRLRWLQSAQCAVAIAPYGKDTQWISI